MKKRFGILREINKKLNFVAKRSMKEEVKNQRVIFGMAKHEQNWIDLWAELENTNDNKIKGIAGKQG